MGRFTMVAALVGAMLSTSCSIVVARNRVREHRRPSSSDYSAPLVDTVVAVAAAVATVLVARSEADDPDCVYGETGSICGRRYRFAIPLGIATVVESGIATYGWWKIHAMRNPPMANGCPDPDAPIEPVIGCARPTWAVISDARAAAQAGNCAGTATIAASLRAREGGVIRETDFLEDADIRRCLVPGAPPPVAEPAPAWFLPPGWLPVLGRLPSRW